MISFLIVEDCVEVADTMKMIVQQNFSDCHIYIKANGEEALNFCKKLLVDVVITDLHMPRLSGDKFIANLRKNNPSYDKTPIIVVSSFIDNAIKKALDESHETYYLNKPFRGKELLNITNYSRLKSQYSDTQVPVLV